MSLMGRLTSGFVSSVATFSSKPERRMTEFHDDPVEDNMDSAPHITQVTRRDIFDYIRTDGGPWHGRLEEVTFLARLYDLEALPSKRLSLPDGESRHLPAPRKQQRLAR
jgi:hypothetical protein